MDLLVFAASLPFIDDPERWKADSLATLRLDNDAYNLVNDYVISTGFDTSRTPIDLLPPRLLHIHFLNIIGSPLGP